MKKEYELIIGKQPIHYYYEKGFKMSLGLHPMSGLIPPLGIEYEIEYNLYKENNRFELIICLLSYDPPHYGGEGTMYWLQNGKKILCEPGG